MPTRYNDSVEKSAEYLRQAIAIMGKQRAGLHPVSYAVWYEYVAGMNRALRDAVDALCAENGSLDEEQTWQLYRRYIAELDQETAQRLSSDMQMVLTNIADSAEQTGTKANLFGNSLARWDEELTAHSVASISRIREDTQHMQEAVMSLQSQLNESQQEIDRLEQEITRAREDALIDGLTGLINRKGFDQALSHIISDIGKHGNALSLLMIDIDFFKQVNDNYGHLFGDRVLQSVGTILKANVKGGDVAARYGGEEFVVLLPNTALEGATALAEKLRATIARSRIHRQGHDEPLQTITISVGVTCYCMGENINDFIARADKALYRAKSNGRNQVTSQD